MPSKNILILAAFGAVLVLGAVAINFWQSPPFSQVEEPTGAIAPADNSNSQSTDTNSDDTALAVSSGDIIIPSFDVVRVDKQGDAVIAGKAAPGAKVRVLEGDVVLGEMIADPNGEWVFLPTMPLQPGNRELSLEAIDSNDLISYSDHVVILVIPERQIAQTTTSDVASETSQDSHKHEELLAVLVPKDNENLSSRVLQGANQSAPDAPAKGTSDVVDVGRSFELQIHTIDYSEEGKVNLSGSGSEGGNVRIYLDNVFIAGAPIGLNGLWRVQPEEEIMPGKYELRTDLVVNNQVVARAAVPFVRSQAQVILATRQDGKSFVTVQPGNSLWRIARHQLGEGINFTLIYERNRSQIVDPDLIYPGQVFEIPEN